MKYNIEYNFQKNKKKYDCIIILISKKNIHKIKFKNKIILKEIKKYKYLTKKNNIHIIQNYKKKYIQDLILIGCGNKNKINKETFTNLINKLFKIIKTKYYYNIIFFLKYIKIKNLYWKIFNIIQIIENIQYKFLIFKTKKNNNNIKKNIYFKINKKQIKKTQKTILNSLTISKGIKITKDLCNTPSNICNSLYILKNVQKYIHGPKIKISYLNKKKIKKIGMFSYLSVNKGSINEPLIIKIKYLNNENINNKPIIIIGKGITFDTGGISLKPSNNMHEMKFDMSGAAIILGIMYIVNILKLKLNIIGILACAENSINTNSTKPGDIIKSLSGKTIEIINTDAEGRLILCDTLTYINKYEPEIVIDIATLTGSCLISLGDDISALFTNNKNLSKQLIKSSIQSNDSIWQLPLYYKYNKYLKSNIADLKNCSNKYFADTILAACFLSNFTKKYKWAHLDIANTSVKNNKFTGRTIPLIIQFLTNYNKNISKK